MTQELATRTPAAPPARDGTAAVAGRPASASGIGGTTKIDDSVVARIAGLAAREVPGVHDMTSTGLSQAFGGLTGRVTGQDQMDKGVAVQVGEVEAIVDLSIVVDYESSIPQVADAIRRNVSSRLGAMTGLQTKEVNINVGDLYFPDQDQGTVVSATAAGGPLAVSTPPGSDDRRHDGGARRPRAPPAVFLASWRSVVAATPSPGPSAWAARRSTACSSRTPQTGCAWRFTWWPRASLSSHSPRRCARPSPPRCAR